MFKAKYDKQILAFLPFCTNQSEEVDQCDQYEKYQEENQSQQCFTPNYNVVEQDQYLRHNQQPEQTKQQSHPQYQYQLQNNQKNQSRIDYSLYERLRGGNAIQYAELIRANCKTGSDDFVQDYRDSGISFLQQNLLLGNSQKIVQRYFLNIPQAQNQIKAKNVDQAGGRCFDQNRNHQQLYQSFFVPQQEQEDIFFKWRLVVDFLRCEYYQSEVQYPSKVLNNAQTQNYRGGLASKISQSQSQVDNYQAINQINKKTNLNKIPAEIIKEIQRLQQQIDHLSNGQKCNRKMFQKQVSQIAKQISQIQNINLERLQKQQFIIEKYKYFLQKVRLNYSKNLQKSLQSTKNASGKRIQKLSTDLLRTQRITKGQVSATYLNFIQQLNHIKKQIESQSRKHEEQLTQISTDFTKDLMNAYKQLKQMRKQAEQNDFLIQKDIYNSKERLLKTLNIQKEQDRNFKANINSLLSQMADKIEQL